MESSTSSASMVSKRAVRPRFGAYGIVTLVWQGRTVRSALKLQDFGEGKPRAGEALPAGMTLAEEHRR